MPFKSQAQRKWMFAAADRGDIPKDIPMRWAKETKNMKKLPEKLTEKEYARERLKKT